MTEALYGPWDMSAREGPFPYDDTASYAMAAEWVDAEGVTVEDWGCGGGWMRRYITKATYHGIDGAPAEWVDEVADLRTYTSNTDRAVMRHVLEHNPDWVTILGSFLEAFNDRAALVTFVPFLGEGCPWQPCHAERRPAGMDFPAIAHSVDPGWDGPPDLHLSRDHVEWLFLEAGVEWDSKKISNQTQYRGEEVFYLVKT